MKTKQVLVVRRDLQMPSGKLGSQCAHASMAFLTRRMSFDQHEKTYELRFEESRFLEATKLWLESSFRKIVVGVDSLEQLLLIKSHAEAVGLMCHLVEDNGTTCFNNVITPTVLAIGPDFDSKIDPITKNLKLLKND